MNPLQHHRSLTLVGLIAVALSTQLGCQSFAGLIVAFKGGNLIEAEYDMPEGPLLILFDDRGGRVDQPKAIREAHRKISDLFAEKDVNTKVIDFPQTQRFKQQEEDYDKLTIREIGEKLGADNVLYIAVEKFTLNQEPGAPIFQGLFEVRCKVVSTDRERDVREWPSSPAGKRVTVQTDPTTDDGDVSPGQVADELGDKLGEKVAKLFFDYREQE